MNDHLHHPTTSPVPTRLRRVVAILFAGMFLLAACGGDDDAEVSSDDETSAADDELSADDDTSTSGSDVDDDADDVVDGPITVETLAQSCDALTPAITSLRGEAPVWVEPVEASNPSINGETFRSADCHYVYDGDRLDDGDFDMDTEDMSDESRLSVRIDHAEGMTEAQKEQMWTTLATTEPVTGLGDEGHWYYNDAFGLSASARVLVGDTVVILSASAPDELDGAAWLAKDPMVAALQEILTILEG